MIPVLRMGCKGYLTSSSIHEIECGVGFALPDEAVLLFVGPDKRDT